MLQHRRVHASFCSQPLLVSTADDQTRIPWRSGFSWWERKSLGEASYHAKRLGIWIALATQAGSTFDEDFPGLAAVVNPDGEVLERLPDWNEGLLISDLAL